ncbi:uncharacterized protein LOC129616500 [Condylostylus longicornis]|uniref:uncharacterized protein LOC129616500 n=1 Tax=Condylostylus longicornis TaxID=2530218 RepID=UPI00244DD18B|nr:uncharacterized protein LOC129616500 [Condylostylus longicornis]
MTAASLKIFEVTDTIATLKLGEARILNGSFNLIHTINLKNYDEILRELIPLVNNVNDSSTIKPQLQYQVDQIMESIARIRGTKRSRRSINWIGTAWKWLAGTPDATDWETILQNQNQLTYNSNQQYRINSEIMSVTNKLMERYNKILKQLGNTNDHRFEQMVFNKLVIIKEAINEIILAIELAKQKIVNTNLLSSDEILNILKEVNTLPYSNDIEAIEYAEPKVITNGLTILYVISLPKADERLYDHILIKPTIRNESQVYLEYEELLVNEEIYGVIGKCENFNDVTICKKNRLTTLQPGHCVTQLIRGFNARCDFQYNGKEIIEEITKNMIFLSNFHGDVITTSTARKLSGSFLLQYSNDTIRIKGLTFTNNEVRSPEVLPAFLQTNLTQANRKLNLEYLHDLQQNNIRKVQQLATSNNITTSINSVITIAVVLIIIAIIIFKKKKTQTERTFVAEITPKDLATNLTKLNVDLRDVDL